MTVTRPRRASPMVRQSRTRAVLHVDHIVTDTQLARLGLEGVGFPHRILTTRPLTGSTPQRDVTFYALRAEDLDHPGQLMHFAGVAAIRHSLQVPGEHWTLDLGGRGSRPDAVALLEGQHVAVEYDAGYHPREIRRKVRDFTAEYGRIIWGTPSSLRASRLQGNHPELEVHTVTY